MFGAVKKCIFTQQSQNKNGSMSNLEPYILPALKLKSSNYWNIWGKLRNNYYFVTDEYKLNKLTT